MLGIVFLVVGLAVLFALLYFPPRETQSQLLRAVTGTLYIGIPALATIGFLMSGNLHLGTACAIVTYFTGNLFFPLWQHIKWLFAPKTRKSHVEQGQQNRVRRQVGFLRSDRLVRGDDRRRRR